MVEAVAVVEVEDVNLTPSNEVDAIDSSEGPEIRVQPVAEAEIYSPLSSEQSEGNSAHEAVKDVAESNVQAENKAIVIAKNHRPKAQVERAISETPVAVPGSRQVSVSDRSIETEMTGSEVEAKVEPEEVIQASRNGKVKQPDNQITPEQSILVMEAFVRNYEVGDFDRMVAMFTPDAIIDRGQGAEIIGQHYYLLFRKSTKRQITIHKLEADHAPHVSARLEARVLPAGDAHSMVESNDGWKHYLIEMEMDLVRMEDRILIARMTDRVKLK